MAATCIMSIHINKGKTARQSIAARLDYIMNPKKTDGGILVSTYACSPETAADEFMLFRQEYQQNTGRTQENEVIGYHVRQAFKPEEITPETAGRKRAFLRAMSMAQAKRMTHSGVAVQRSTVMIGYFWYSFRRQILLTKLRNFGSSDGVCSTPYSLKSYSSV